MESLNTQVVAKKSMSVGGGSQPLMKKVDGVTMSMDGESRRQFLQAAGLGLAWSLGGNLGLRAADRRGEERSRSLITIWLQGGPSQLETWDPHPGTSIGGPTTSIPTSIPGCDIASHYPRMAEQLKHLSVVRSLISKEGDHERASYLLKTGYRPEPTLVHPAIVAIAAHERPNSALEIPQAVALGPQEFPGRGGFLGDRFDPFRVFDPGVSVDNLKPLVDASRQERRLGNLGVVSQSFMRGRRNRVEESLHQHTVDAALRMMKSEQIRAFELTDETAATKARYGETPFGRGCLVARRLLETGVRSIEVTLAGFDGHAKNFEMHTNRAKDLDPALSALLADLVERDLLQSTVVLVIGEFGRTPKVNPLEGRDHWPTGFSCLIGGGGLRAGAVIGATDPRGEKKDPERPVEVKDLYATILSQLGVDYAKELITPIGRPMRFCEGSPVADLLPA